MSLNEGIQEIQGIRVGRDRREVELWALHLLSAFSFQLLVFGFAFALSFKLLAFSFPEARPRVEEEDV